MKIPQAKELVLYEDENFLVLNKPPMITSEHDSGDTLSLADIIRKQYPEAMLCHRLDKETSGVIVAARNQTFYRFFSMLLEDRAVIKEYHAIIAAAKEYEDYEIEFPISKKGSHKAVIDKRRGKQSLTVVNTLEKFKDYALLQAFPVTGRFHQIRVHMASVGVPLVGDSLYGGKPFMLSSVKRKFRVSKEEEEQPVISRAALHAARVSFAYPENELVTFEAPYPKDFEITLKLLRKNNSL